MQVLRTLVVRLVVLLALAGIASSQKWQPLTHQPPFQTDTALLLTDGTVMMHEYSTPNWWRLKPNQKGNYVKGTWSKLASMPSNYGPLYFASAVLPDGRVIVEGGEYNFLQGIETNLGAIYDPFTDQWTNVNPPSGWSQIGDAPGIVLADGTFMLGHIFDTLSVLFDAQTLTWTPTGTGKKDRFAEEGWALLPDGTVLTTDALNAPHAEKYYNGKWISAGNTIVRLEDPGSQEIGPMILRPDGTLFATGANASGAGHTSVYHPPANPQNKGKWVAGPDIPDGNDMADAAAALLPNGNVLCDTSPGIFQPPVTFYEYDGTQFTKVPSPGHANSITSYEGRMLVLPTGQVLWAIADGRTIDVEIYKPAGKAKRAWAPTITSAPGTVTRGSSYSISGTQFNGLSAGADYGDDAQMASNYPLVRITNDATGHVFYARTHDHSTMAVATGSMPVSTNFDVPTGMETGASHLEVVAVGIASDPVAVTVQ
jgi:hypothetical protein